MEFKSRKPTDSELFLYQILIQSPKINLETYDKLLSVIIGVSGVFLSLNDLQGQIKLLVFVSTWISLIIAIAGILPDRKEFPAPFVDEIKEFISNQLRFKRNASVASICILFLSFGLTLVNAFFK